MSDNTPLSLSLAGIYEEPDHNQDNGRDNAQPCSQESCPEACPESFHEAFQDGNVFLFPFTERKRSLFSLPGNCMLAAGLAWTKADPGLSLRAQADAAMSSLHLPAKNLTPENISPENISPASLQADDLPDHGRVIEERAGFASLYGKKASKDSNGSRAGRSCGRKALPAFCKVYSLAALRLQSLRHGIEIWPLPYPPYPPYSMEDGQAGTVYWVYAARLGRLSARADQCLASREDALALARRLQESLDIQSIRELSPEEAAAGLKKLSRADAAILAKARLRPVRLMASVHNSGLCRVLAAVLWAGLVLTACYVLQDPITQRISPARHAQVQKAEQQADTESAAHIMLHPERYFPSDWLTAPSPAASVLSMVPAMLDTPLAANGWTLEELSCSQGSLTASWKAARASSLLLPPHGAERLANDATRARSVSETKAPHACKRQWQDLYTRNEMQAVLSELAARFGLKMELSWQPARTIRKDDVVITCPWTAGRLVLSQAPGTLFYDFASLAGCLTEPGLATGMVLSQVSWNKKQWSIQGEVYAKP